LRPWDAQDIAKLVQFANRQGLKVAMRGQGHSFFGQTQVAGGVVIDSSSLNAIRIVKSGTGVIAEIGAGSKWHPVLMAANAQKLTVPVITDTFLLRGHCRPWRTPPSRPRASARSCGIASSSLTMSFRGTLRPTNRAGTLGIEIDHLIHLGSCRCGTNRP